MTHRATQVKGCLAADHSHPAHQHREIVLAVADRQQIGHFDHRAIAQPAGLQDVGVRQVNLLAAGVGQVRG
ncbi:hypothetical protein D3C75_1293040 [compost metagenome]